MTYAFVVEDLKSATPENPLWVQFEYAKEHENLCLCSITSHRITDFYGEDIDISDTMVLLRATCDSCDEAMQLISNAGGQLFETADDITRIESWYEIGLNKRRILSLHNNSIFESSLPLDVYRFLSENSLVFLKTKRKGFSALVASWRILSQDDELKTLLDKFSCKSEDTLLISKAYGIKNDSLGRMESRHFVFNNKIMNSSRPLHSLAHSVPKTLLLRAEEIVYIISTKQRFPANYVLDMGFFLKGESAFIDIVEINPITTSLSYVNNSIFDIVGDSDKATANQFGVEYIFNERKHPGSYLHERSSFQDYSYVETNRFNLF